ncbi:MAG: response regulator [Phycisphaeraceae bacterium]|nr:response regulator [Phycisphaeraceae bacterium]
MSDRPRVLVVDDEAHIVHVVTLKLQNAGFEVITASDGEEGLAVATDQLPNLIVTDYQMPFVSGLEMCTRLRQQEQTSHIPVLMLTARGFSIPTQDLAQTNIRQVLSKPFSPRDILARVQELIDRPEAADAA